MILHETGGQKYFEAVSRLGEIGAIDGPDYYEFRVIRLLLSQLLKHHKPLLPSLKQACRNALFRLRVPFVCDRVIILGMAPWDIRLVWYRLLAQRNTIIYHTSWVDWAIERTPHRYGILNAALHAIWQRFLSHPNVRTVAVTSPAADALKARIGIEAAVIPHTVSEAFFAVHNSAPAAPFGLLFVGQLTSQKGVELLPEVLARIGGDVTLGVVGDGPYRDAILAAAAKDKRIHYYGSITNRSELASIYAQNHVLLVPSIRTSRWQELFGMVIPEAMAAGLVVIASNHAGPQSILANGGGMLVPEGDVDEIAECIEKIRADRSLWAQYAKTAHRAAEEYSLPRITRKWQTILDTAP